MASRLRADTVTALLALALAAYIVFEGKAMGLGHPSNPGSGYIQFWTGLIMAGLSITLLVQSLLPDADKTSIGAPFSDTDGIGGGIFVRIFRNVVLAGMAGLIISFVWWYIYFNELRSLVGNITVSLPVNCFISMSDDCRVLQAAGTIYTSFAFHPVLSWISILLIAIGGVGWSISSSESWGKVIYVTALLVLYTVLLEYLGFIIATALLLVMLFKTVEPQSWTVAIIGSALTTAVAWGVFVAWLGQQLPTGSLLGGN